MRSFTRLVVGACALATVVQAAPINVVTVTDLVTVTTWTTVDAVATVWVSGDQSPAAATPSSTAAIDPSAGVFAPSATFTTASAPTTVATVVVTTTTTSPTPEVVTSQSASFFTTSTTTTTPPVVPVTTQPTTTIQATTTTTTPYSPATTTASSGSAPAGPCVGQGSACTGDITHWDGGLGACGWNVNTDSDMQIALPVGLMGSLSNSNPYCGKSVSIHDPTSGVTIQATVGDKCMGCSGDAIDLTNAAFNAVTAGQGDGRVHGIQWWFN